ncbi:hypothetical protein PM082_024584 [Marasmius tenuissimus]|nr:hypothetical protein PM082_024584 [Marasmius tenuissimus]
MDSVLMNCAIDDISQADPNSLDTDAGAQKGLLRSQINFPPPRPTSTSSTTARRQTLCTKMLKLSIYRRSQISDDHVDHCGLWHKITYLETWNQRMESYHRDMRLLKTLLPDPRMSSWSSVIEDDPQC